MEDHPAAAPASLARSSVTMAVGTGFSRLTGFGRNIALAVAIGQGRLSDSYNVANTTPNIVYELLLGGVLSATLIPIFVEQLAVADRKGPDADRAWRDTSAVVTLTMIVATVGALLFALAAPVLARTYLSSDATAGQLALATSLVRLFAIQIVAYAVTTLATALLNTRRRFASPMFAPVANNVIVIVTLLLVPRLTRSLDVDSFRHDHAAVAVLGLGTSLGVVAMGAILAQRLVAVGLVGRTRLRPVWEPRSPVVRRVASLSGWTLGIVVTNQIALWVVYRLATRTVGAQSSYVAAMVFFLLPYGIYAVSIRTALQPTMAEHWLRGELTDLGRRLRVGLRTTLVVIVPAGVGLCLIATPLVASVLQHGKFGHDDTVRTGGALAALALGLPGFAAFQLLTVALQAMKDLRTVFLLYCFENVVNVIAAVALFPSFGVRGLAASYGIAYTAAAIAAAAVIDRRVGRGWRAGVGAFVVRIVIAAAVMGAAVALVEISARDLGAGPTITGIAQCAAAIGVAVPSLLIAARVLKVAEISALVSLVQRPFRKLRRR